MKENNARKNRFGTAVALAAASLLPCAAVAVEAQSLGVLDPEDATTYLSAGMQIFKGDLVKQGTGTNALSVADVHAGKGRVVVADGVLALTGATTANQPPKPLGVLTNAAVWFDASLSNTIGFVEGSTVNVSQWLDVRETGDGTSQNPYRYWRAVSYTNLGHSATYAPDPDGWFPTYSPAANGENAYVDFGQYSSGRTMRFRDSSGNVKSVEYLLHAFVVLGTHDGHYGFVVDPGGGSVIFVPQNYGSLVNCTMGHFIQSSQGWTVLLSGVFRVDGVAVDPVNDAKPNGGYQLLDIAAGKEGWKPQGFFSHNDISNDANGYRQGGGRLCEVILFNKSLDERDRVKVEAYLRHKWFGAKVSAASYVVGEKATLAIDNSGGGDGVSSVAGNGIVDLVAGGLDMPDPVPLATYGGNTYSATTGGVERTSSGGATLVKSGDGTLVVGEVASGVAKIDVQGGIMRLRQGVVPADPIPTNLCGYIEDPSFEAFADQNIGLGSTKSLSTSSAMHGWKSYRGDYTYDSAVARYKAPGQGGDYNYAVDDPSYSYPDGTYVGVLHITGGLQTTVTLPADGIYRLSYWLAQRPNYRGHEHRVLIDGIPVAQVKAWDSSRKWHLCSFRLPWLAAGEHTLVLASDNNDSLAARTVDFSVTGSIMSTGNLVGMVDDFHVDWIESGDGQVAISNASFEVTSFSARGYEQNPADLGGWEYVSTNELNYVFLDQTWNGLARLHPASDGCRILNLVKQVQIGQDITFPEAGTYILTCAAGGTKQDVAENWGKLRFSLGGSEIGTLECWDYPVMKKYSLPFTVSEGNLSAKLVIASLREKSVVSIDDIRIAKVSSAVIEQNTFASGGWSKDEPPSSIYDGSGKVSWITRTSALELSAWGETEFEGEGHRVGIRNKASIWRTVAFPAAGTYRLTISSIGRFYRSNDVYLEDPGILTRYSGNVFNAWVAKGGVTNVVGTFGVDDRERFVTHRFLFELPEGGDWEVGFSGLKESQQKVAGSSNYPSCGGVLDGRVIEQVTPKAKPTIPQAATIEVADGATLALDYLGTNEVAFVRHAGKNYSGDINAQTCPAFITGVGALYVRPKGTVIMFR